MKRILLHVGMYKTGSTSIQAFLQRNQSLLDRHGCLCPVSGRGKVHRICHNPLAWSLREVRGYSGTSVWRELAEEIASSPHKSILISAEGFGTCTPTQIGIVRDFLQDHDVRILIYLRNPLSLMVSAFQQVIRGEMRWHRSFADFLDRDLSHCNYPAMIDHWASVFDRDHVIVRVLESVTARSNLFIDFLTHANLDRNVSWKYPKIANVTPSADTIRATWILNRVEATWPFGRMLRRFSSSTRKAMIHQTRWGRIVTDSLAPRAPQTLIQERDRQRLASQANTWMAQLIDQGLSDEEVSHLFVDSSSSTPTT